MIRTPGNCCATWVPQASEADACAMQMTWSTTWLINPLLREHLREGDPLRGRVQLDGSLTVYCCYPPEAAGLIAR